MTKAASASLLLAAIALTGVSTPSQAQDLSPRDRDALIDVILFGLDVGIDLDPASYPVVIRPELQGFLDRSRSYRSTRAAPPRGSEADMVYRARARYESRLAAIADDPGAAVRAVAYVDSLQPCYEWEGYHDCPEGEAEFAERYQLALSDGAFKDYLLLLAGHRWLCTAEAYDYERNPAAAARSRERYQTAITKARGSSSPLIRFVADSLVSRNRCLSVR